MIPTPEKILTVPLTAGCRLTFAPAPSRLMAVTLAGLTIEVTTARVEPAAMHWLLNT